MVIVTHEMELAKDIGQKMLFMDKGLIVEQGVPEELLAKPKTGRMQDFLARFHGKEKAA